MTDDLIARLRCYPANRLCRQVADALEAKNARIAELEAALKLVLDDIADYERVNNLSPNPGKRDCWQSVSAARAALGEKHDNG